MATLDLSARSIFADTDAWAVYEATLQFTGLLVGGAPSDPKLIEGWLTKNLGITDEEQLRQWTIRHLAETQGISPSAATDQQIEEAIRENAAEKKAQVFKRTATGEPYIEGRHAKAMLKEATSIAYPRGEHKFGQYRNAKGVTTGGKDPRSYLAERVFVPEAPIVVAEDIDGVELAVGHLKDWRGETRSTLGYFEYCEQPTILFPVRVLDDCVSAEQWARIWTVAEMNGLGARRSQGAGQFVVTGWDRLG